ncbi:MAG: DNA recombination protein RmuC [Bacteroidota bacterium]
MATEVTLNTVVLFMFLGLIIGGLSAWLMAKLRFVRQMMAKEDVEKDYILKSIYEHLALDHKKQNALVLDQEEELRILTARLAGSERTNQHLEEQLELQKEDMMKLHQQSRIEFENIANRLLEEKSQQFTQQNQVHLQHILSPLKDKIKTFEEGVEKRFLEETRDRISLKKEIEHLRLLNQQLSEDANNLASALKGGNKTQGDWGEIQLELLLEKAGLFKDIHYQVQSSFRSEKGKLLRPDFIINLPENKHLIIDSKVSLVAYEKFYHAENEVDRKKHLKQHLDSIRAHIKDLSQKNYQNLYQIHSPDYLLLFIPIESAFAIATQADNRLFLDALDRNIVIVSTSTLLATMRTVSFIWKQEKQKNSVLEIARQSGLLYDKFVSFVEDLRQVGNRIEQAQSTYKDAMNKLTDAKRYGDTLIGKAQKIKELGAKTSKSLPDEFKE